MSACLAIVLGVAAAAGYPAPHGLDHLRITGAEFRQDVKKLDLSDKQLARAKAIHSDYAADFADALEAFKGGWLWVDAILPSLYEAADRELDRLNYADRHSSPVDLVVKSIRGVTTIDPRKRESIDAIYLEYSLKRDRTRQRILEAIRQWQRRAEAKRRYALHQQILAEGGDIDVLFDGNPVIEHLYERRALAKEACRQIRGLFAPQEFEALPQGAQLLLSWKLR